jgi:hypothetical protein
MSTKTEIVVCRAFYHKVFSAIFRQVSFSTATSPFHSSFDQFQRLRCEANRKKSKFERGLFTTLENGNASPLPLVFERQREAST